MAFERVKRRYVRRIVRQPRGNRGRFLDRIQGPRCRERVFDQPGISPLCHTLRPILFIDSPPSVRIFNRDGRFAQRRRTRGRRASIGQRHRVQGAHLPKF